MNHNLEEIFNRALALLKKGRSQEEVLLEFARHKTELAPLLKISQNLLSLPRNTVPTPQMQRRYAAAKTAGWWFAWGRALKLATAGAGTLLVVSTLSVMAYQAYRSFPGQPLFAIKKQAEQIRLFLAYGDENAKANLQIQLAQQRLDEAQEIFTNPSSAVSQKQAALNEALTQSQSAVEVAATVVKNNPDSENTHPLISNLNSLAKKQQSLLAVLKPDPLLNKDTKAATQTLTENAVKVSQIKQYVIAAANSQVLATINSDPNSVAVLGQIKQVSKDQITVESLGFQFAGQMTIKDSQNNDLSLESLKIGQKVNVTGEKNQNNLIARQIVVVTQEETQPKNDQQQLSANQTSTPTSLQKILTEPFPQPSQPDLGTATGQFIIEGSAMPALK